MKNFYVILSLISLAFTGCQKEQTTVESSTDPINIPPPTVKTFAVDSVAINDSLKIDDNLTLSFKSTVLIFPSINDKSVLDSIYEPEKIRLDVYSKDNIQKALKDKMSKYYSERKNSMVDWTPDFKQTWSNNSRMDIQSTKYDYVTIKYSGDGFTGGAHGYYYELYKVVDLKNNKTLQLNDLLSNQDEAIWNRILMDNFLKNDVEKGQGEMLLVQQIPLNSNFYFDEENLYFLYNQYEITAYAAGPVLIKIPLSDIKPFLKDDFKERLAL